MTNDEKKQLISKCILSIDKMIGFMEALEIESMAPIYAKLSILRKEFGGKRSDNWNYSNSAISDYVSTIAEIHYKIIKLRGYLDFTKEDMIRVMKNLESKL
ncbi:MAG TPA: hypothetical protein ENI23_00565 [bacterium]|nr:hypothetical protein [bacterium]